MAKLIFLGTCSGTEPMPDMCHSAIVVETGGGYYWFDAGETCSRNAYLMGIDLLKVRSVFISHPHMDHVGGLANLMWNIRKLTTISDARPIDSVVKCFLPNLKTWEGIMTILSETEENFTCDYELESHHISDGVVYEDRNIKVTAYHNHHLGEAEDGNWQSFSFCIETGNKRIIYSGDIRDEYDLDSIIGNGCDILIVETGHHKVKNICSYATTKNVGKLLFTHHGREIINNREEAECVLSQYPIDALICSDGLALEI